MIDVDMLFGHVNYIWPDLNAGDLQQTNEESKVIGGILYRHLVTNQFIIRDPRLRRIFPAELYQPIPVPPGLETRKIFLDLYYDDFGAYRNVYHAVGGVYLVIGNLPLDLRQKLWNIFLVGFVPSDVGFDDYIRPFINELRELQHGIRMNINGTDYWVIAGLNLHW